MTDAHPGGYRQHSNTKEIELVKDQLGIKRVYGYYESRLIKSSEELEDLLGDVEYKLSVHNLYPRVIKIEFSVYDAKCSQCGVVFTEPKEASNYCGRTYCHKCRREEERIDNGET